MNDKMITALDECLKAIEHGTPVDEALSRYPDIAEEIRPYLLAAQTARELDSGPVPAQIANKGRSHLLAQVNSQRRARVDRRGMSPILRFGLVTAVVLAILAISGGGLLRASANSLPDDPLYGVKRTAETIQLGLTFDPAQKDALEDEFSQRRIDETESLLSDRRTVEVKFSGMVEAQLADGWLISGIHVLSNSQTEISGTISTGAKVEVEGLTQTDETVLAQKIRLDSSGQDSHEGAGSGSSGEGQGTEAPTQDNGKTPGSDGGSSNSGSGGSGSGEETKNPTQDSSSGSNSGTGDITKTPEPTRTSEPTKSLEPSRTQEPSRTEEPTRTPESTRTPEPTK